MLGRVESPGFQHTAVMLGCVEPSEAAPVANSYRNTAHTRRHIPIGGSVAGEGGVAHRSTQQFYWVAWSRAARDGFCGRGCDVIVSMFPRSEILIEREKKKSEAQLVANTYWNITIERGFCAWEGGVAWIPAHSSYVGLRRALGGCTFANKCRDIL